MRTAAVGFGVLGLGGLLFAASHVSADEKKSSDVWPQGLIARLPPDGSWTRFELTMKGVLNPKEKDPKVLEMKGTLILSSVGRVRDAEEDCRWIELKSELALVGMPDNPAQLILKVLVPEKRLVRGEDPFADVRRMYYARKGGDKGVAEVPIEQIKDDKRKRYEIERFRSLFPAPLKDAMKTPPQTLETKKLGKLECECVTGTGELPKSPLRDGAEWAWKGKFEFLLSDKVPFGVAALRAETEGYETNTDMTRKTEIKMTRTITVLETGDKASSALPKGD